jgi:hypothetical protein
MTNKILSYFLASGLLFKGEEVNEGLYTSDGKRSARIKTFNNTDPEKQAADQQLILVSFSQILCPVYVLISGWIASVIYLVYELKSNKY